MNSIQILKQSFWFTIFQLKQSLFFSYLFLVETVQNIKIKLLKTGIKKLEQNSTQPAYSISSVLFPTKSLEWIFLKKKIIVKQLVNVTQLES